MIENQTASNYSNEIDPRDMAEEFTEPIHEVASNYSNEMDPRDMAEELTEPIHQVASDVIDDRIIQVPVDNPVLEEHNVAIVQDECISVVNDEPFNLDQEVFGEIFFL